MKSPWFIISSIAASGNGRSPGTVNLIRTRTLSITTRLTCGASVDANPLIEVYYSPDSDKFDTTAYASWEMTYSAGNTIQLTKTLDMPEHGEFYVKISNQSSADVLTNSQVWYSIQAWPNDGAE